MTSKRARSAIPVWVALAPFLVSCSAPQAKGRVPSSAAASPRAAPVRVEQEERAIPVDRDDPTWGSSDAAVTVVAFMDFECPFCAEAQDVVSELEATYAKGDLRFVFKHHPLPVHTGALHAAFAAQAVFEIAGVEAFREYARILFANQRSLSVANLMAWAEEVGVGRDELKAEFTSAEVRRHVLDDVRLALHIGATGTPAFRINGVPVRGVVPVSAFKDIIDAELVATAELARKGVAPDEIYARRVESNWKTPARSAAELPMPEELLDTSIWKVSVEGAPTRGPSDAPVTIVEFSEFQCPFCAMGEATLDLLLDKHPGKLRVAFRHNPMPFHEHAVLAAELALEARAQHGDAGFFEAARLLFGAQRNLDADALLVLAQKLKLDMKRTQAALARHVHRPAIEADQDLAEALQVEAVPQFFINGRRLVGAQPIGRFEQIIGERLADAEQLMAEAKVPPARLYDELMKDARAPVELERKDIGPPPASSPSRGPPMPKWSCRCFPISSAPTARGSRPSSMRSAGSTRVI